MDSRDQLDDEAPLSITRTFLRQAAALGLPDATTAPCAPFAAAMPPPLHPVAGAATEPDREPLPPACRLAGPRGPG